ncbi:IS5 family transposase [Zavarzinella formosa]|uniref:IS5 family transposase n=1 Tax=Zavarzinella formosa TaxID=360055 RepID=UPI0002FDACC5|nr:IS5 family transposase [Zavarzinella formosa]
MEHAGSVLYELTDHQWNTLIPFFPPNGRRGKQWKDHRVVIDGILGILSDGGRWRNLPERFGPWKTIYERFRRWSQARLWDVLLDELQLRDIRRGRINGELRAVDASVIRAHQSAAGASKTVIPVGEPVDHALGRSQGGFGTKVHLIAAIEEEQVLPLAVIVSPGQQHETQQLIPLAEAVAIKGMSPEKLAGDKTCSAKWIREYLLTHGVEPVIPHQKNEPGRRGPFDRESYRWRNLIERVFDRLKWFRRVAARYEKLTIHYAGMLNLAILYRFFL